MREFTQDELQELSWEEDGLDGIEYLFASKMIDGGKYQNRTHYFTTDEKYFCFREIQSGSYFGHQESYFNDPEEVEVDVVVREYILLKGYANHIVFVESLDTITDFGDVYVEMHNKVKEELGISYEEIPV